MTRRYADDVQFGVAKVADRRWQAFACRWGKSGERPVGPVFKTQWEAIQQAHAFAARRTARFNARRAEGRI